MEAIKDLNARVASRDIKIVPGPANTGIPYGMATSPKQMESKYEPPQPSEPRQFHRPIHVKASIRPITVIRANKDRPTRKNPNNNKSYETNLNGNRQSSSKIPVAGSNNNRVKIDCNNNTGVQKIIIDDVDLKERESCNDNDDGDFPVFDGMKETVLEKGLNTTVYIAPYAVEVVYEYYHDSGDDVV
ncbi:hypothetical protein QAD02_011640 [Eretmocerus hayati]|uniref:Uncharacterized protein n=1 Tax=Eretmocerus hayati TaxID=131215 RepID=A0ACC2NXQ2_9HYME|nr:hypothetical protein QAD02_011640 [Eretmocerus hayati]